MLVARDLLPNGTRKMTNNIRLRKLDAILVVTTGKIALELF